MPTSTTANKYDRLSDGALLTVTALEDIAEQKFRIQEMAVIFSQQKPVTTPGIDNLLADLDRMASNAAQTTSTAFFDNNRQKQGGAGPAPTNE